ncbi:transmembrane protein 160 [Sinocyclocheilus anshuiensis]|uniref:Transmembrane protein 160-like n=1 Tax=Sinocyclocheilus anshuiensis TaxID=1608454 RepID=A0A671MQE1_9TELE|nr:PREDICTED: transmembrane protein 160-like [Sinocyclocheilus anshuiensis]
MASISWLTCRRFAQVARRPVLQYVRAAVRALHRSSARRAAEKTPLNTTRALEQQNITELDKADALMLRKSHETGFLSWFRNGLLATGIGVIAFAQSDVGREAGYVFFILGGVCVSFGGASYVTSLLTLRRIMLLSRLTVLLHAGLVSVAALFWLCAVSLYIGRLELEIIHEEDEEEHGGDEGRDCAECRARRERRGAEEKGQDK